MLRRHHSATDWPTPAPGRSARAASRHRRVGRISAPGQKSPGHALSESWPHPAAGMGLGGDHGGGVAGLVRRGSFGALWLLGTMQEVDAPVHAAVLGGCVPDLAHRLARIAHRIDGIVIVEIGHERSVGGGDVRDDNCHDLIVGPAARNRPGDGVLGVAHFLSFAPTPEARRMRRIHGLNVAQVRNITSYKIISPTNGIRRLEC